MVLSSDNNSETCSSLSNKSSYLLEFQKRKINLSKNSIYSVLECSECRPTNDPFKCNHDCLQRLGTATEAINAISELRSMFWVDPATIPDNNITKINKCAGRDIRNSLFIAHLFTNLVKNSDSNKCIIYRMGNNVQVCKYFFRMASGLNIKAFNKAVNYVLNYENPDRNRVSYDNLLTNNIFRSVCGTLPANGNINICKVIPKHTLDKINNSSAREEQVLAFLDRYFLTDVDWAPEEAEVRYTRSNWLEVYNEYKKHCESLENKFVGYQRFTQIRKNKRPIYKKHRAQRPGGWNHLECSKCNCFKRDIRKESDDIKRKELESELQHHLQRALYARQHYYKTRTKAMMNKSKGDMSVIIDAGGGSGCCFLPRMKTTEKGEPARHMMMKTKSTFVKVHGIGSLVVLSLPDLEKQGGNLTFECTLQAIKLFLTQTGQKRVRNLYLQLDNVSSNKSYALLAALSALVKLGICKKVKVSYLEVGHTHEDIDALIGTIVSYLRGKDITTFENFVYFIKEAIHKAEGQVKEVIQMIGITDYEYMFEGVIPSNITGLSKVHELRISVNEKSELSVVYKTSQDMDGWLPKPIEADNNNFLELQRLFRPSDPNQGILIKLDTNGRPGVERGMRQHWIYKAYYSNGDMVDVHVKCISIPVKFQYDSYEEMLQMTLDRAARQALNGPYSHPVKRQQVLNNIKTLLRIRREESDIPKWDKFFGVFDNEINCACTLYNIAKNYGGNMILSIYENIPDHRPTDDELVQPVTFIGGPVKNRKERARLLSERVDQENIVRLQGKVRKNKQNKKPMSKNDENTKSNKPNKKRKVSKKDESDEEDFGSDGSEESRESTLCSVNDVNSNVDESSDEDIVNADHYKYLIGTCHYDPEDDAVFRCTSVDEEQFGGVNDVYVVVYREQLLPNGNWLSLENDPIHLQDVLKYHNNAEYQTRRDEIIMKIDSPKTPTVEDYQYLIGTTHYDNEDNKVFKVVSVVEQEFDGYGLLIVVYRERLSKNGRWIAENDPICVNDVVEYYNDNKLQSKKEEIMSKFHGQNVSKKKKLCK